MGGLMRKALTAMLAPALIAILAGSVARAEDSPDATPNAAKAGFQAGVRVGYVNGLGVVYQGVNLNDATYGAIPVIVDLGWRIIPQLYAGLYGQYAPVFLKTYPLTCPQGLTCAAQDWRFGVEADYHILPHYFIDPYVGLGFGYEVLHSSYHGSTIVQDSSGNFVQGTGDASVVDRGWEFGSLTVGADWRFNRMFAVGLFLVGTLGQYNVQSESGTVTIPGQPSQMIVSLPYCTGNQQPPSCIQFEIHGLLAIGARGTFNL